MRFLFSLLIFLAFGKISAQAPEFLTPFERDNSTTATYHETIEFYKNLAALNPQLQLKKWGMTDAGYPLHVAVISKTGIFKAEELRSEGKAVLFINNAIHPGEPEGVDATMMLFRDILQNADYQSILENVVVVTIPYYNIGGGLNRGSHSRANQNGPSEYGFRGNSKNLDLNRDFIKCDSRNAQTFSQIFTYWKPDVFMDNHTSNGADYPYTMTLLTTQEDKLGPVLGSYLREQMLPAVYGEMERRGWEMTPYVNVWGSTPRDGIPGFNDSPRYGSGYGAVHHCLSFVPETHMLKPFPARLDATYQLMDVMLAYLHDHADRIIQLRKGAIADYHTDTEVPIDWRMDRSQADTIVFKGYEGKMRPSEVTGLDRLWYDRSAPWVEEIPYWNHFKPTVTVKRPQAYIIPKAYTEVAERLRWNGVELRQLSAAATPEVEMYYIRDYEDRRAYEGHYLHHSVEVEAVTQNWKYYEGDFVVLTDQPAARFVIETLEPQAPDSYFAWNFFDAVIGQKEYFSPYVFEDIAAEFLKENPDVRAELEAKRQADPEFAKSQWAQLYFVYQRTPYYEPTHQLYPVARVMSGVGSLPMK